MKSSRVRPERRGRELSVEAREGLVERPLPKPTTIQKHLARIDGRLKHGPVGIGDDPRLLDLYAIYKQDVEWLLRERVRLLGFLGIYESE